MVHSDGFVLCSVKQTSGWQWADWLEPSLSLIPASASAAPPWRRRFYIWPSLPIPDSKTNAVPDSTSVWGKAGGARTCAWAWPRGFERRQESSWSSDGSFTTQANQDPSAGVNSSFRAPGRPISGRAKTLTFRWNSPISIRRTNWGIDYTKWWLYALEVLEPKWENGISMKYYGARGGCCVGLCVTSEERERRKSVFTQRCCRRCYGAKGRPCSRSYFTSAVGILDTQMRRR